MVRNGKDYTPSVPQRSSIGRTAARAQAAAAAEAAPATAPTAGVAVEEHGHGALVPRGAAKTPEVIVNKQLMDDCWKETPRGVMSRAQFEAFCKSQGIRVQWLNLDGGGVNCVLHLMMGKKKRTVQIQCQYKHGQDHFSDGRLAESFGVPELLYVDDDGNFQAQYAPRVYSSVVLRIHHAAPEAAISVRALYGDLVTLALLDSTRRQLGRGNWVECTRDGRLRFAAGSMGPKFINRHNVVQKSLAPDPTKAAVVPYINMRAADAHEQFKHVLESQLTLALSALRAAHTPLASKLFLRKREVTLGPFDTPKAKGAAEKIASEKVAALQLKLVAASSWKGLVVAPTTLDGHLAPVKVKPLAFVAAAASTPEEAITGLGLLLEVRGVCRKNCLHLKGSCKCKLKWKVRGKLLNITRSGDGVKLYFDDKGKDVTIPKVSQMNERVKPASGNGDGLSLVRKAARAAVAAGWEAPPGLASLTRGRGG